MSTRDEDNPSQVTVLHGIKSVSSEADVRAAGRPYLWDAGRMYAGRGGSSYQQERRSVLGGSVEAALAAVRSSFGDERGEVDGDKCSLGVKKYVPGMEPIRCFSLPVLRDKVVLTRAESNAKARRDLWKANKARNEKNPAFVAARDKRYRAQLEKIASHERDLQVSGEIATFRRAEDRDCYDPSKSIRAYDPEFARAARICNFKRWSPTMFHKMMDELKAKDAVEPPSPGSYEAEDGEEYTERDERAPRPTQKIKYVGACKEEKPKPDPCFGTTAGPGAVFLMTPCCSRKKKEKAQVCKDEIRKQVRFSYDALYPKSGPQGVWKYVESALRGVSNGAFKAINSFIDRGFLPSIESTILMESAMTIAEKIRDREYSCLHVLETFIRRIEDINTALNCVTYAEFAAARKRAAEIDRYLYGPYRDPNYSVQNMPLLGVPFCTQENIGVKGRHQTAGLRIRWKRIAKDDSAAVGMLRRAGAIFLAQTNVSELCLPFETSNRLYGRTNNPYDVRRCAGGSAGGAAALISAAGCPFGIGADMLGSVRISAAFCGIYTHKPVSYAVSQAGIFPNIPSARNSVLSVAPMAKHASDLLPLLTVLADPTESESGRFNWNKRVKLNEISAYYMVSDGGERKDATGPNVEKEWIRCFEHVINHLNCILKMKVREERIEGLSDSLGMVMEALVTAGSVPVSEEMTDRVCRKDITIELVKKLAGVSDHSYALILSALLEDRYREGQDKENREKIRQAIQDLKHHFTSLIGAKGIFLYPTYPFSVPFHGQTNFSVSALAYSAIFNVLDFPVTQIPIGLSSEGVPFGLQIVTLSGCDHIGFAVASELEKLACKWQPPCLSPPAPKLPKTRICDMFLVSRLGKP